MNNVQMGSKKCGMPPKRGSLSVAFFFQTLYFLVFCASLIHFTEIQTQPSAISEDLRTEVTTYLISSIATSALLFTLCGILAYGVLVERPNFMLPYLVVIFMALFLFSICTVIMCGSCMIGLILYGDTSYISVLISAPILLFLCWYLHYIIFDYYRMLSDAQDDQTRFYNNNKTLKNNCRLAVIVKKV